jgi:hypothetical protein
VRAVREQTNGGEVMNEEQLAALQDAYDWLKFAMFDRLHKTQDEFDLMIERLEAAFPVLVEEAK